MQPCLLLLLCALLCCSVTECCDNGNLAGLKVRWQSSHHSDKDYVQPYYGNDGYIQYAERCSVVTGSGTNEWWRVDLYKEYRIEYGFIYTPKTCTYGNMKNIKVLVARILGNEHAHRQPRGEEQECWHRVDKIGMNQKLKFSCKDSTIGRFVTLLREEEGGFCLNELQVYGKCIEVVSVGKSCDKGVYRKDRVCVANYDCPKKYTSFAKCSIPYEGVCNADNSTGMCFPGAFCDQGKCRIGTNKNCGDREAKCHSKAECYNGRCMVKPWEDCRGIPFKESRNVCSRGYICDVLRRCKKPDECSKTSECQAGAQCKPDPREKLCVCQYKYSWNRDICGMPLGSAMVSCAKDASICPAHSSCRERDGVKLCLCDDTYVLKEDTFTCERIGDCSNDYDCENTTGWMCDRPPGGEEIAKCALKIGQRCDDKPTSCARDALCEDICRLKIGSDCSKHQYYCRLGAVCDNGKCKYRIGKLCGLKQCVHTGLCDLYNGQRICRLSSGESCAVDLVTKCASFATCEKDDYHVCRTKVGEDCSKGYNNQCQHGSTCDRQLCRLKLGQNCSEHSEMCVENSMCDALHFCRKAVEVTCTEDLECVAGATCISGKCQCDVTATSRKDNNCVPNEGHAGGPCSEGQCNATAASCDSRQSLCVCDANYTVQRSDFTCVIPLYQSCKLFPSRCGERAICDVDKVCRLGVNETCNEHHSSSCRLGTMCQNETCKLNLNQPCLGPWKTLCGKDLICDPRGMCKKPNGSICYRTEQCSAGASCSEGRTCACNTNISLPNDAGLCEGIEEQVGGRCNSGVCLGNHSECDNTTHKCVCVPGYAISADLTCMLQAGESCANNSHMCESGSSCQQGQCKLQLGSNCEHNSTECVEGAVCDVDLKCKVDYNGDCSGYRAVLCRLDSICDNLEICRKRAGALCNTTEECSAGSVCSTDTQTCRCFEKTAYPMGDYCMPVPGQASAQCSSDVECSGAVLQCDDVKFRCTCKEGISLDDHTYQCAIGMSKKSEDSWMALVLSFVGILGVIAVVGVSYSLYTYSSFRKREAMDELKDELETRREAGEYIKEQVDAILEGSEIIAISTATSSAPEGTTPTPGASNSLSSAVTQGSATVSPTDNDSTVSQTDNDSTVSQGNMDSTVSQTDNDSTVYQTDNDSTVSQNDVDSTVSQGNMDSTVSQGNMDSTVSRTNDGSGSPN